MAMQYSVDSPPQTRVTGNVAVTVDPTLELCTGYPLLLDGQLQCGFKACPSLLMTRALGIGTHRTLYLVFNAFAARL